LQPWETYSADTSIDLTRHHEPKTMLDKIAYWTVKSLRFPTDVFFQVRARAWAVHGLRCSIDQFGVFYLH